MEAGRMVLGMVIFLLLVFVLIGGPVVLMDRFRSRRQEAITRQIAVTETIDGQLGAIVAPVVKKPLWGPWQIQIAVPFDQPEVIGRILALTHGVFAVADRMDPARYQVVLTATQDAIREERTTRAIQRAERWPGEPIVAA